MRIPMIEDTRKSLCLSVERFFYEAYLYAETPISARKLLDMIEDYFERGIVHKVVLDYTYDVMCGVAKKLKPKGKVK